MGNLFISAQGKEPLIVPVSMKQKTDAVLVTSIMNIKQAWGVAINHKDQLIIVAGREGLKEEMARSGKEPCEGAIKDKDKEGEFKGGKVITIENDSGDCILILSPEGEK